MANSLLNEFNRKLSAKESSPFVLSKEEVIEIIPLVCRQDSSYFRTDLMSFFEAYFDQDFGQDRVSIFIDALSADQFKSLRDHYVLTWLLGMSDSRNAPLYPMKNLNKVVGLMKADNIHHKWIDFSIAKFLDMTNGLLDSPSLSSVINMTNDTLNLYHQVVGLLQNNNSDPEGKIKLWAKLANTVAAKGTGNEVRVLGWLRLSYWDLKAILKETISDYILVACEYLHPKMEKKQIDFFGEFLKDHRVDLSKRISTVLNYIKKLEDDDVAFSLFESIPLYCFDGITLDMLLDPIKSRGGDRFKELRALLGSGETIEGESVLDMTRINNGSVIVDAWTNSFFLKESDSDRKVLLATLSSMSNEDLRTKIFDSIYRKFTFDDPVSDSRLFFMILESMPVVSAYSLHLYYLADMFELNQPVTSQYFQESFLKSYIEHWKLQWAQKSTTLDWDDYYVCANMYSHLLRVPMDFRHQSVLKICDEIFAHDPMSRILYFKCHLQSSLSNEVSASHEPTFSSVLAMMKGLEHGSNHQLHLLDAFVMNHSKRHELVGDKMLILCNLSTGGLVDTLKLLWTPNVSFEELNQKIYHSEAFDLNQFTPYYNLLYAVVKNLGGIFLAHHPRFSVQECHEIKNERLKVSIVLWNLEKWMDASALEQDDLIEFISLLVQSNYRFSVLEKYFGLIRDDSNEVDHPFLSLALEKFQGQDNLELQYYLLKEWEPSEEKAPDYIRYLLAYLGRLPDTNRYDLSFVSELFLRIPASAVPELIAPFAKEMYPNSELFRVELFKYILRDIRLSEDLEREGIMKFAPEIDDDALCLELLHELIEMHSSAYNDDSSLLSAFDILQISSQRVSARFKSIKEQLDSIPLGEALLDDKLEVLNAVFDNELDDQMPLTGIFTYFNLIGEPETLIKILTEKTKAKIKKSYQCPEDTAFMDSREHRTLLLFDIPELPRMTSLCAYLKSRQDAVLKIPPLNESILNLEKFAKENAHDWEFDAKARFLELLNLGSQVTEEQVLAFFRLITGLELPNQSKKLYSLFNARKAELAYLFSLPNGVNDYIGILLNIADGCIANIATKTNMYILGKLFQSQIDQVVFPFFIDKIFTPHANQGDDILGADVEGTPVFQNWQILSLYLSPPALIQGLADQLADDPKKSSEIIKSLAKLKEFQSFKDNILCFEDPAEAERMQAKLAAYLIVREIMKDDFKNEHFRTIEEKILPLMSDDFELGKTAGQSLKIS